MRSPRLEAIAGMGFHTDESGCAVPHFLSQLGQDWWIYVNHARFMKRPGTYVDLATNDPITLSAEREFLFLTYNWRMQEDGSGLRNSNSWSQVALDAHTR